MLVELCQSVEIQTLRKQEITHIEQDDFYEAEVVDEIAMIHGVICELDTLSVEDDQGSCWTCQIYSLKQLEEEDMDVRHIPSRYLVPYRLARISIYTALLIISADSPAYCLWPRLEGMLPDLSRLVHRMDCPWSRALGGPC